MQAENGEVEQDEVEKVAYEQDRPPEPKIGSVSCGKDIDYQKDGLKHDGNRHVEDSDHREELVGLSAFVVGNNVPEPNSPCEEPKRRDRPCSDRPINVR